MPPLAPPPESDPKFARVEVCPRVTVTPGASASVTLEKNKVEEPPSRYSPAFTCTFSKKFVPETVNDAAPVLTSVLFVNESSSVELIVAAWFVVIVSVGDDAVIEPL